MIAKKRTNMFVEDSYYPEICHYFLYSGLGGGGGGGESCFFPGDYLFGSKSIKFKFEFEFELVKS